MSNSKSFKNSLLVINARRGASSLSCQDEIPCVAGRTRCRSSAQEIVSVDAEVVQRTVCVLALDIVSL